MFFQHLLFFFPFIVGITSLLSQDPNDVHFYFYSSPSQLTNYKEILIHDAASLRAAGLDAKKEIVFLVHGFNGNSTQDYNVCRVLGKAYLKEKFFPNIICVDYGKLTQPNLNLGPANSPLELLVVAFYPEAVNNIKIVGKRMAEFIQFLIQSGYGPTADNVQLIGHSLGGHVIGTCGMYTKKDAFMTIGRITGLDPAGPLIVLLPIIPSKYILSPSNAKFVEVLHTNSDFFGTTKSLGTVDWWVNGGRGIDQAECADCLKYLLGFTALSCGHNLAITTYARSITQTFLGCKCKKEIDLLHPSTTTCEPANENGCSKKRTVAFKSTTVQGNYYLNVPPIMTPQTAADLTTACSRA